MTYEQYTNGNGVTRRSSQEIQSDLQNIRGEIQGTLQALSNQLQPGQLLHQAWVSIRGGSTGGRFIKNLSRAVEENPIPVVLIGAGFGYLMYSDARQRRHGGYELEGTMEVHDEGAEPGRHRRTEKLRQLKDSAQGRAHRLREGAHDVSENVKEKFSATRSRMQEMGTHTQENWRHMSERARHAGERGRDLVQEQPLILAGLGLALGAAFAAFAPMTRKEHQMLGDTGRQLKDQARHMAHEATERAKAAGSEVLDTAKQEARGQSEEVRRGGQSGGPQTGAYRAGAQSSEGYEGHGIQAGGIQSQPGRSEPGQSDPGLGQSQPGRFEPGRPDYRRGEGI
jgi:ElaB/YqjD/DUF883 family membrane-anchored ribosome-binding protein